MPHRCADPGAGEAVRLSVAGRTDAGSMRADRSHRSSPPRRGRPSRSATRSTGGSRRRSWRSRSTRLRTASTHGSPRPPASTAIASMWAVPDPFTARYVWHHPCTPDVRAMRAAARHLVGSGTSARSAGIPVRAGRPCGICSEVRVTLRGDRLEVGFRANAFLHQMVRALTGILVAVGEGRSTPTPCPRSSRPETAPRPARSLRRGLTLERVVYGRRRSSAPPSFDARLIAQVVWCVGREPSWPISTSYEDLLSEA